MHTVVALPFAFVIVKVQSSFFYVVSGLEDDSEREKVTATDVFGLIVVVCRDRHCGPFRRLERRGRRRADAAVTRVHVAADSLRLLRHDTRAKDTDVDHEIQAQSFR